MSDVLAASGRHAEAGATAHEALATLIPYAERYPETYADLARTIRSDVLKYSNAGGIEPDPLLLQRVARMPGAGDIVAPASESLESTRSDSLPVRAHPLPPTRTLRRALSRLRLFAIVVTLVMAVLAALAITGQIDIGEMARSFANLIADLLAADGGGTR
jgi:hypothetical protein